jgi:hypothetical protein
VRKKEELRDGYQRKMKEIFIARRVSHDYSNGRPFGSHTHPLEGVVLRIVHRASVIKMVKQIV